MLKLPSQRPLASSPIRQGPKHGWVTLGVRSTQNSKACRGPTSCPLLHGFMLSLMDKIVTELPLRACCLGGDMHTTMSPGAGVFPALSLEIWRCPFFAPNTFSRKPETGSKVSLLCWIATHDDAEVKYTKSPFCGVHDQCLQHRSES